MGATYFQTNLHGKVDIYQVLHWQSACSTRVVLTTFTIVPCYFLLVCWYQYPTEMIWYCIAVFIRFIPCNVTWQWKRFIVNRTNDPKWTFNEGFPLPAMVYYQRVVGGDNLEHLQGFYCFLNVGTPRNNPN